MQSSLEKGDLHFLCRHFLPVFKSLGFTFPVGTIQKFSLQGDDVTMKKNCLVHFCFLNTEKF